MWAALWLYPVATYAAEFRHLLGDAGRGTVTSRVPTRRSNGSRRDQIARAKHSGQAIAALQ